ncbi:DUF1826 domain-containing protein [Alteromonas sp. KUL49]|nr:DUF1826 domain-containing protein [Alteromonas sp. KUL49]
MAGPSSQTRSLHGGTNMLAIQSIHSQSWSQGDSPMALSEIIAPDKSVAIWKRLTNPVIQNYFDTTFSSLGMGIRQMFELPSLKEALMRSLPDGEGKNEVVEDIYLLSDVLTCLFDCEGVGLRLVPLTAAMCPKFHTDQIPVRLVNTYLGQGTEFLPVEELLDEPVIGSKSSSKGAYHPHSIQQLDTHDVGLLKGSAWDKHEHMAAIHRSCKVANDEKRVLLTLDPI